MVTTPVQLNTVEIQFAGWEWENGQTVTICVVDGRFDGMGPLACLSPFFVKSWIRSNYLF